MVGVGARLRELRLRSLRTLCRIRLCFRERVVLLLQALEFVAGMVGVVYRLGELFVSDEAQRRRARERRVRNGTSSMRNIGSSVLA